MLFFRNGNFQVTFISSLK